MERSSLRIPAPAILRSKSSNDEASTGIIANVYEYGRMVPTDFIRETRPAIPIFKFILDSTIPQKEARYERKDYYVFLSRRHDLLEYDPVTADMDEVNN